MQALVFIEAHGKIRSWSRAARAIGADMRIVATGGHLCRFPNALSPLGIKIVDRQAIDETRTIVPEADRRIGEALDALRSDEVIMVATDDDAEGDVIAFDLVRRIVAHDRALSKRILRVRPSAITRDGIDRAIRKGERVDGEGSDIVPRAIQGISRAISDRWIGATYSNIAGTGCGRVRAAVLGMALCWSKGGQGREFLRGVPETGELTFQAKSSRGGMFFTARVPLTGSVDKHLLSVARRYAGKPLPGHVTPMASIGAAVAPRFGDVAPFNTGDALAYAGRFHDVSPRAAMRGLQDAYMKGRISYPRTENRHLSETSANLVVLAARNCKIGDVTHEMAARHLPDNEEAGHEALHPTPEHNMTVLRALNDTVRKPFKSVDSDDRAAVEDLMVALVARRAFEAARSAELAAGVWHPREDGDLTREERAALEDLEWNRPAVSGLPWPNHGQTGARFFPAAAILIDGMMIEGIGRPSTWAGHAESIAESGQIRIPGPGRLPEPSPEGVRVLKALPRHTWAPATCRGIEEILATPAEGEENMQGIAQRQRGRIDGWLKGMPREIYDPLVATLRRETAAGGRAPDPDPPVQGVRIEAGAEIDDEDYGTEAMMDLVG